MKRSFVAIVCLFITALSFAHDSWRAKTENPAYIHRSIKQVTDVMVHDIYSPPVCSRTYAYISIAGYQAALGGYPSYRSLARQLRGMQEFSAPEAGKEYSFTLASVQAMLSVARNMVISEKKIIDFHQSILDEIKLSGIPADVFDNSVAYGLVIAKQVMEWAAKDNYKETRALSRYAINTDDATWKPTPPAYMKAVEPHWNKIRTFLLDSAQQFKPAPATVFSGDKASQFYSEALAVREAGTKLTEEQKSIAAFWDCNPFKMNVNGHVMYASKKISPGGHWINIAAHACQKSGSDVMQSLETYACLSITIADAFISCWDEKYRSSVVRPETYINRYIDPAWLPFLQTPPFPEYTSGHSVISTAAAVMLEKIFGENFAFSDSTELEFGIPARQFTSFRHAAEEAAISRFYGGIHYMPAIVNGSIVGRNVGNFVLRRLKTRN
jgi:hypothetical protein